MQPANFAFGTASETSSAGQFVLDSERGVGESYGSNRPRFTRLKSSGSAYDNFAFFTSSGLTWWPK
jgi:hypothetical protein